MTSDLILLFAGIAVLFQLGFQGSLLLIMRRKPQQQAGLKGEPIPITIIVCARNEASNLPLLIGDLISQSHTSFEVLLVDDNSTDQTADIMQRLATEQECIRHIDLSDFAMEGKKDAITKAVELASYEHLIFTDADCRMDDHLWLQRLAHGFDSGSEFVIGTGGYLESGGLISRLYQLEAWRSAMLYHAACRIGSPYMCVGRSMGYTKSLFRRVGGFQSHQNLAGGSDDLFLLEARKVTKITSVPEALTWSTWPQSARAVIQQKKRHLSVGGRYPIGINLTLMLNEITTILLIPIFLFGLIHTREWPWTVLVFLVIVRMMTFYVNLRRFDTWTRSTRRIARKWWLEWPMSCWNALISVLTLGAKEVSWKTRR